MMVSAKDRTLLIRVCCAIMGLCLVGLFAGTFLDQQVSNMLYVANQPLAQLVTGAGVLALSVPLCIVLGGLVQRTLATRRSQGFKLAVCLGLSAIGLFDSITMTRHLFNYDGVGPLLPFAIPGVVLVILGIVVGVALMALGYASAQRNGEAELLRRLVIAAVTLVVAFLFVELIKNIMHRPRWRTLVLGHEGIEFQPWYRPFGGSGELMQKYGLESDAFKSFPSGHCQQVGIVLVSFYGLAALYPAWRRKWLVALNVQVALVLFVPVSRIVLGAHFLSDVSVGLCVSLLATVILLVNEERWQDGGQRTNVGVALPRR